MNDARAKVEEIAATLDALLKIRFPDDAAKRAALAVDYLGNEFRRHRGAAAPPRSLAEIFTVAERCAADEIAAIRSRCLFYGCDALIALLVNKRIRSDSIAREEAVLYIQDRLQRDNFRRIRSFDADRGASFVTYMWQVIGNLLMDFARTQSNRPEHVEHDAARESQNESAEYDDRAASELAEPALEASQLQDILSELLASGSSRMHPLRERLRPHLKLSAKERVFLKAMFQYDMSINEIRELPGFDLGLNESYRFYYRIIDQVVEAFKSAGVLEALRAEVSETLPRVAIHIDGDRHILEIVRIQYLEQLDRHSTACHADWREGSAYGVIAEGFSKLSTRFLTYFTGISTTVAVADRFLAASREWTATGVLSLPAIGKSFRIGKRQRQALAARFAEKSSSESYT